MDSTRNVRVCVRCRPFIPTEIRKDHTGELLVVSPEKNSITIRNSRGSSSDSQKTFTYDQVFDETATQQDVFAQSGARDIVHGVASGYHGTIFAYGQTSSGKTHTMEGYEYKLQNGTVEEPNVSFNIDTQSEGIMPQALREIFAAVHQRRTGAAEAAAGEDAATVGSESFTIRVSYVQIYMEQIYDLLAPGGAAVKRVGSQQVNGQVALNSRQRRLRWDRRRGFFAENLHTLEINTPEEALVALQGGVKNKIMAKHNQNLASSRSHCIFQVHIQRAAQSGAEDAGVHVDGASQQVNSTLSLVDLAGSERQASTGTVGASLKESIEINTSLFVLRKVIQALAQSQPGRRGGSGGGTSHVPYRDSKLTSLLKDSLGGNSNTLMIACLSPSDAYVDENGSTLEYASTAKRIANRPVINEDANTRLIRKLRSQVLALKEQLGQAQMLAGIASTGAKSAGGSQAAVSAGPGSGRRSAARSSGAAPSPRRGQVDPKAQAGQPAAAAGDGGDTVFHPFDTDYGRHLGEKVVESVTLLKRMVETNTELRTTSESQATQLAAAERSNIVLMEENGQLRERLSQLQQLLLSGGADPSTVKAGIPAVSGARSGQAGHREISSAPRQAPIDPLQGIGQPPTPASARGPAGGGLAGGGSSRAELGRSGGPGGGDGGGAAGPGGGGGGGGGGAGLGSSKAWLVGKDSLAVAMDVADQALAAAGVSTPASTAAAAGPGGGTGGMDPKLFAALYGPLPGSGGFGGALPSEQSYQKLEKASSLTSSLASQASTLRNENNAMEERLHALTASMDGMLKSNDLNPRHGNGAGHSTRAGGSSGNRNSSGLRDNGNQWAFSSDAAARMGSSGPIAGRRRQNPNKGRNSAGGGQGRDGGWQ